MSTYNDDAALAAGGSLELSSWAQKGRTEYSERKEHENPRNRNARFVMPGSSAQ